MLDERLLLISTDTHTDETRIGQQVKAQAEADPENCFGRGTAHRGLSRRRRRSETPPSQLRGLGECRIWGSVVSSPSGVMGRSLHMYVYMRFHACFSAFRNRTSKANKTDPIRPFLPAKSLEGALCPPSGSAHVHR